MVRLLHITDIHFGPPHDPAMDEAIRAWIVSEKPAALLVSGDLTQRALPGQFREARAYLDSLSVPQVVVPGNHDVPLWALHERMLNPFGRYRAHFSNDLEPTLRLPQAWIFGLNTAKRFTLKNGVFRGEALARMEAFFDEAPPDVLRVVVGHHHLLPAPGPLYDPVASRARDGAHALSRAGVDVLVAGHLHHAFVLRVRDFYPSIANDPWVAHAGTSMSTRGRAAERGANTLNVIEYDGANMAIESLRHQKGGGFERVLRYEIARRRAVRQ
jgi:3',5'-cyclic AMP phosphodiesterase CpdA